MASTRFQTSSMESAVWVMRMSLYSEPPAQSGSVGSGSDGVPGDEASDQRVSTLAYLIFTSAKPTARSKWVSPP